MAFSWQLLSILLFLSAAAALGAAEAESPSRRFADRSISSSDGPPVLLDFDASFRFSSRAAWTFGQAMFRVPWSRLSCSPGADSRHALGGSAFFEQGWNISPNPRRYGVMACYTFGGEFNRGTYVPFSTRRADQYPWWRLDVGSWSAGAAAGWIHADATERAARRDAASTLDALRLEAWAGAGAFIVHVEGGAALDIPFATGSKTGFELRAKLSIGRPFLPVGIVVGYWYIGTGRIAGHHATLGLEFDL